MLASVPGTCAYLIDVIDRWRRQVSQLDVACVARKLFLT
jgi:hypothetical protein